MINKIKDFLKNKFKRNSHGTSAEDEIFEQDDSTQGQETQTQVTAESRMKNPDSTGKFQISELEIDSAPSSKGEILKQKLSALVSLVKGKIPSNKFKGLLPQGPQSSQRHGALLSPRLGQRIETFLSRSARESIHQTALVLIICAITYTLGKMSALVMRGTPSLDSAKDYTVSISLNNDFNPSTLAQVKSINIFKTNEGTGNRKNSLAEKKCDEAEQKSNLPIKLLSTIVLQDSVKSLASVQIRGERELQEFRVGDQISNLAKIFKITRLELLVKNLESGMCESIVSDNSPYLRGNISVLSPSQSRDFKANKKLPGIENTGNKFTISKTLLDEKLKDIGSILTQARAIQIKNPDGSLSFKMTELDPQGLFPYLGIQDQDIITSINGKPIYDMNEVMLLFGRIKNLDNLSLGIKREGSDSVQDYSIKK